MNIPQHILDRKGPRSLKNIDSEVVKYLNKGLVETKNLMEWLAADQMVLLTVVLQELGKEDWLDTFKSAYQNQRKPTANSNAKAIGATFGILTKDSTIYDVLKKHTSDLVRCWACWAESLHYDDTKNLLKAMQPYAADKHFGVREVVIFATKERLIEDLDTTIKTLVIWAEQADENVRRFAAEAIRPIGVWTKKIPVLQENPSLALKVLKPLNSDSSKYVRDAVGNWLNDASKSQPVWVQNVCDQWKKESSSKETAYIIKRGLRTINKK